MSDTATVPVIPRVLALMRPTPSDSNPTAATPVAWAVKLHDDSVITIPVRGRPSITPWSSIHEVEEELDVYVKHLNPQDIEQWGQVE